MVAGSDWQRVNQCLLKGGSPLLPGQIQHMNSLAPSAPPHQHPASDSHKLLLAESSHTTFSGTKRMETFQTSFPLADESSQMWSLNKRLEAYLARVKALEEENELLRAEIHHLRKEPRAPSVRTYHEEIMKLRDALDDGHQKMVEAEMARDNMYQEIELVKDLCLQEKRAQEEVKREMSESKKLLEDERRAQTWLKERLVQLEEEMEDILRVHEEDKAAMEEEISSFSQRLDSFKVAPVAFQPINLEDYSIKLSQVWQGAVEDYKNEVSSLESSLSEAKECLRKVLDENKQSQLQLQNLERELQSLKSRKEMLEEVLEKQWLEQQEEEGRLQLEIETLEKEKQDLRAQIAQVLEDRQQLMHLKMSLSLEVATYRSLLEAESTRIYSPTADYKLSSPFSESVLEKSSLRKRQTESTKTPVARDYRTISTKRQTAEKTEQLSHTPSRHLNVKSTSFSSRPSPVTKEFQKVSSVLQSQSLKYTKAPTEKATATLSSLEKRTERRPPTEDVSKKSNVEAKSYSYSQASTKATPDKTVTLPAKEQPSHTTVYSKHDAELTKTETLENGFLLPGEQEVLEAQQKIDHLESTLKTVKDHYPIVHETALEDQAGSLKVDVNVQDLHSSENVQEDVQQRDLPGQELDLVLENEEVVSEVVTCQRILFEKQEVVQSLEYQNIETTIKEDVTDHRSVQIISEPCTEDAKTESLARTSAHEQESSTTLLQAEREEPAALSSDVVSEYEPLTQQEQDSDGQVLFELDQAMSPSSDTKEDAKQWADDKDTVLANQNFEIDDTEQDNFSLEKVENESKLHGEQVIDQQILSTPKQDESQEEEEPVVQSDLKDDVILESPDSLEKSSDDALNIPQINEQETDLFNTEQHSDEVIVSEEVQSLSYKIEDTQLQEDFDLKLAPPESLLEEHEESMNTVEQEEYQLSDTRQELDYFEGEVKKSDITESSQEHDTKQATREEFVSLHEDTIQISENSQELNQEEQKSLEWRSSEEESEAERKTQIICVTEHITEQFIVDNKEFGDQFDAAQSENLYLSETGLKEIQQELETLEKSDKEKEILDILSAEEEAQIEADQSVDKSQEQLADFMQDSSVVPEAEPLDSLQSFQEEQKDTELAQIEHGNKVSLDEDSSPLDTKETILSANNVIEEPRSDEPSSVCFEVAENDVNVAVEEQTLSQFCEMKEEFVQTFAKNVDLPEELKGFEPQVADEGDVPTDTDFTASLQKELLAEEEAEPHITHDFTDAPNITNIVQEIQPEEHEPEETCKIEEDIQLEESEQANQELVEYLACALLREEEELEKPISADRIQEPETSYEQSGDIERKVTFQEESEKITQWAEELIMQESHEVLSTITYSEKHDIDIQLVHQPCDRADGEESAMTDLEPKTQIPENEPQECILESEIIESVDSIPVSKESKDTDAVDQEPEVDHEPLCGTQPEITVEKEIEEEGRSKVTQEETSYDNYEDVSKKADTTENEEENKDFRDPEADQVSEPDQQQVTDAETTNITPQESTDEYSSHDIEEKASQNDLETAQDTENEESKDFIPPEGHQEAEIDQQGVSDSKISNQEESEIGSDTRTEEVHEETCEVVSTKVEHVFSEKNEEVELLEAETDEPAVESTEHGSQRTEFKAEVSGSENIESDIEPVIQESQNSDPEKPELVQETLSDTQQETAPQQEDSDEHFTKDPEEQIVTKVTEWDTTEEEEQDSKDFRDSEANEEQDLVKEPLLETEPQLRHEEKNEDVCINSATEEDISRESDEVKSTEQDTTAEDWHDIKDSRGSEAEQVQEPLLDVEPQLILEEKKEELSFSEAAEEEVSQEPVEPISKTAEEDTTAENQEDSKESKDSEDEQRQESTEQEISKETDELMSKTEESYASKLSDEAVGQETDGDVSKTDVVEENKATPLTQEEDEGQIPEIREEDDVGDVDHAASDDTQNIAQFNDPEVLNTEVESNSAVHIPKQETELDLHQCTEPKDTSQQESEDEEKEVSEENDTAASTFKDYTQPEEVKEIVSDHKEPEDDQKIPFSLSIIQNNLRFTSESNAEVQPETQGCELSTDGTVLALDEKKETADLQNDGIDHGTLHKEEAIVEDQTLTESKQEDENIEEKEEETVSQTVHQDSAFALELNAQIQDQATFFKTETTEQKEEQTTTSEAKSEPVLVEHSIEQKLDAENPSMTSEFEGTTEEQSEAEDVHAHSNLDDDNSKSDQSLDSQDISIYSQKSEDFEISKDYQLEQTLPDSTPLPNLDEEFEDLAEDKEIITSEEAQTVAGSYCPPEPKEEVLDSSLESESSQLATEVEVEEAKPESGHFSESSFATLDELAFEHLQDSEIRKAENENTESVPSEMRDHLETSAEHIEEALPDTTPSSNLTDGLETLAEEQEVPEAESVSETTELLPAAEQPESESAIPLNMDIMQNKSTDSNPEQSVRVSGDDSDLVSKEERDQCELITEEVHSTESVIDSIDTEEAIIISDLPEDQSDESNKDLKATKGGEESGAEIQLTEKTAETSVILESDHSISSDETSPNVTAIGHEGDPEDGKGGIEETSEVKEISDEFEKVGFEEVEVTGEDETLMTTKLGQEASLMEHVELHTSDEEKDTTGESSDSSFDSNSGNEREAAEEQHSSSTESNIYVKTVNGLHENTIVQATLDLEDLLVNGHSTGEQSKIVISERKTIVKVEEDIINTHTQDIIEESVLKFATSEGKGEGLFQSLLEKSELKEGTRLDEPSTVEYVDSATNESHYTKKTIMPYLSDSDFTTQTDIKPSLVDEGLIVDKDTNQQTLQTQQEKEDTWSSDE